LAEVVNLDALIPREDFIAPPDNTSSSAGELGKPSASATDLTARESFFETLRKPDFQRETAAWTPGAEEHLFSRRIIVTIAEELGQSRLHAACVVLRRHPILPKSEF
jgi:hypothetical protein